jgi:hypothetical protein
MEAYKRKSRFYIILAVSLLGFVGSIVIIWFWYFRSQKFDPVIWQDQTQIQSGIRLRMADQLISNQTLINLTRAEVIKQLGNPASTVYFKDWDMVYYLGDERGFMGIDSEWLVIRLDVNERVRDYKILRD